jgi:sporulation protein YlmC with PRC-barrel domain
MAGLLISDQFIGDSGANILGVILIIGILGLLVFLSRNKIKISIEKAKEKLKLGYSKNSIKGLIKKKVYTEEGEYVGKVSGVIIGDNKIDSLKIKLDKLDKRKKAKVSGIIVKYRNVINTGDIVIIDYRVLEYLNKFQ